MSTQTVNANAGVSCSARLTTARCSAGTVIVGMPSAAGSISKEPAGRCSASGGIVKALGMRVSASATRGGLGLQLRLDDLLLQLDDPVDQRLGTRRTARDEHVHRHDLVHSLDDRVVVEHAADRCASTHGD